MTYRNDASAGARPRLHGLGGRNRVPYGVGFLVSVLVHLALIALYPFFGPAGRDGAAPILPPDAAEPRGTQLLQIVELAPGEVTPEEPVETTTPEVPDVAPETPDVEDRRPPALPDRYRSAAERLRPGSGDPRLWQPLDPSIGEPTPEEVARLRLLTAIESMSDSALAEAERAAAATDWTYTDDDGNRWGVSPGRLHLGGVSIPLPFGFGPPPDYNGDQARRAFELSDLDRAAGSRAVRDAWRERLEVMRQRREERRAREEAEEREPPRRVVPPDTTRSRR